MSQSARLPVRRPAKLRMRSPARTPARAAAVPADTCSTTTASSRKLMRVNGASGPQKKTWTSIVRQPRSEAEMTYIHQGARGAEAGRSTGLETIEVIGASDEDRRVLRGHSQKHSPKP